MENYNSLEDAKRRIKELETKARLKLIQDIKRFANGKFTDEELKAKTLEELEICEDSIRRYSLDEYSKIFDEHEEDNSEGNSEGKYREIVIREIDFERTFEDVNAEFNMTAFSNSEEKSKSKTLKKSDE